MKPTVPVPPRLAIGIGIIAVIIAGMVIWGIKHHKPAAQPTPVLHIDREIPKDLIGPHPTPAPPSPYHAIAPTPVATPPLIYQGTPFSHPSPISEATRQRQERALKALAAPVMLPHQTEETPQLMHNTTGSEPIMVTAKPAPPHTVSAWTLIDGTLETGIDSDHPGDVLARVSHNVLDSVTQTELLIPMGSILHGTQGGKMEVTQNDTSSVVSWDDIEFPNGAHVPLPRMPGLDTAGYTGFTDVVEHHYARTWVPAFLKAGIVAGTMLAAHPTYGGYQGYDPTQQALGSGMQSLGGNAQGELSRDLNNNKPTITIRPGYEIRILVTRDLVFPGAYQQ